MKFIAAFLGIALSLPAICRADVELRQVSTGEENGYFAATLQFNTPVAVDDLKVDILKDALNITIANGTLPSDKNFVEVGKENVKSISSTTTGNDILTKIIFAKGVNPEAFKNSYRLVSNGDQVKVLFKKPEQDWSLAALGIDTLVPTSLDAEVTKVAAPAETAPATEAKVATEAKEENISLNTSKKEDEIPVLTSSAGKKETTRSPYARLVVSLFVIGLLAFGIVNFSKWWQKRHGRNTDTNRIRVLTQHHLGPKKSLAIIRVAGETILIGVTDANISMIKTLALLEDEEVPDLVPKSFAGEMKKNGAEVKEDGVSRHEDDEDNSAFSQIRDRISTRIKEMRPL